MHDEIVKTFGNRLRVRACGVCTQGNRVLLAKHNMGNGVFLWSPPGGGLEFGETAAQCLQREFLEETGIEIKVKRFLFVHEFFAPPLHGIELFFEVEALGGQISIGRDPEMAHNKQILQEIAYLDFDSLQPTATEHFHASFGLAQSVEEFLGLSGYFINGKPT